MQGPPADPTRPGLARFRSAPATWLDALLDDDLHADPLKHEPDTNNLGSLTQLLTSPDPNPASSGRAASFIQPTTPDSAFYAAGSGGAPSAFQRMNSSPAEFMGGNIDGYFSSFGIPSSSYDFAAAAGGSGGGGSSGEVSPAVGQRRELTTANSLVEMEMEKLMEDSVPCRVRAKRGCATHPRSIAERVRRTRISDRIRKLQELVPNMDKQTNTADMLEEAVEYVKTLQRQIQELTEQQKRCKCKVES
ncbi:hypothetical protein vseg_019121 [Gypsophila vaccaria]